MADLVTLRRGLQDAQQDLSLVNFHIFDRGAALTPALRARLDAAMDAVALAEAALAAAEGEGDAGVIARRGAKAGGQQMGAETTGIDAAVSQRMAYVPTSVVHMMTRDDAPLVTFTVKNAGQKPLRLRLSSWVEGFSATAIDTVELKPRSKEAVVVHQLPTFFVDALCGVKEVTRASLVVRIEDLGSGDQRPFVELERSTAIPLLARTTLLLAVPDPDTGDRVDLMHWLGAFVTPNVPIVHALLREAAELAPGRQIVGYQVGPDGVLAQVKAVFDALKARDLTYVNSVVALGDMDGTRNQRVRLPRQSIEDRSANCIDGTVLMASVLEAASINPALVIIPGHAFLAWETQRGSGVWDYLETTRIGSEDFETARSMAATVAAERSAYADQHNRPRAFRRLDLRSLRARGVLPME